jgi:ankyrin repeat protein
VANLSLLLECGAAPDYENALGITALMAAVRAGNVDAVVALLEFGASVNYESKTGETAFSVATAAGNREVMNTLLARGANAFHQNKHGLAPLAEAVAKGDQKAMADLFSVGVDPNFVMDDGNTMLMYAARSGKVRYDRPLIPADGLWRVFFVVWCWSERGIAAAGISWSGSGAGSSGCG